MAGYILYDDSPKGKYNGPPISAIDANKQWANHSYNSVVLTHIAGATTDFSEKAQALKELTIAEGKMKFWERQANFFLAEAMRTRKRLYNF
jgi:hypothetical protein